MVAGGAALVSERRADHELEHVERDVGDEAEHPDGAGPRPADALDAAELPVGVHGDGRGHQLGGEEGEEQQVAPALPPGSMHSSHILHKVSCGNHDYSYICFTVFFMTVVRLQPALLTLTSRFQ